MRGRGGGEAERGEGVGFGHPTVSVGAVMINVPRNGADSLVPACNRSAQRVVVCKQKFGPSLGFSTLCFGFKMKEALATASAAIHPSLIEKNERPIEPPNK